MADEVRELWRLEQLDRAISRKESLTTNGYARSAVEDELDARTRRVLPRHDQVAREATKLVLLFLRQLFSDHKQITWKGSNGTTDADSDIVIESVFADRGVDRDLEKPTLIVRPGPRATIHCSRSTGRCNVSVDSTPFEDRGNIQHMPPWHACHEQPQLSPARCQGSCDYEGCGVAHRF